MGVTGSVIKKAANDSIDFGNDDGDCETEDSVIMAVAPFLNSGGVVSPLPLRSAESLEKRGNAARRFFLAQPGSVPGSGALAAKNRGAVVAVSLIFASCPILLYALKSLIILSREASTCICIARRASTGSRRSMARRISACPIQPGTVWVQSVSRRAT